MVKPRVKVTPDQALAKIAKYMDTLAPEQRADAKLAKAADNLDVKISEIKNMELEAAKDAAKAIDNAMLPDKDNTKEYKKEREELYTQNELRHKHFKESKDIRTDISAKVKAVITDLNKDHGYKIATLVGNAGGKRKILECPYCEAKMVASGIKLDKNMSGKPPSQSQKEWFEYVNAVAKITEYKDIGRQKVMKAASTLRKEGYSIDDIKRFSATDSG